MHLMTGQISCLAAPLHARCVHYKFKFDYCNQGLWHYSSSCLATAGNPRTTKSLMSLLNFSGSSRYSQWLASLKTTCVGAVWGQPG